MSNFKLDRFIDGRCDFQSDARNARHFHHRLFKHIFRCLFSDDLLSLSFFFSIALPLSLSQANNIQAIQWASHSTLSVSFSLIILNSHHLYEWEILYCSSSQNITYTNVFARNYNRTVRRSAVKNELEHLKQCWRINRQWREERAKIV